MICSNCNFNNEEGAKFCRRCGMRLNDNISKGLKKSAQEKDNLIRIKSKGDNFDNRDEFENTIELKKEDFKSKASALDTVNPKKDIAELKERDIDDRIIIKSEDTRLKDNFMDKMATEKKPLGFDSGNGDSNKKADKPKPQKQPTKKNNKAKTTKVIAILASLIAVIAIVFAGITVFNKNKLSENSQAVDGIDNSYKGQEQEKTPDIGEEKTTEEDDNTADYGGTDENTYPVAQDDTHYYDKYVEAGKDIYMQSVDASNTQNYMYYTTPDDFEVCYADGYSFGYPKDYFNNAEEITNGYQLTADSGAMLKITVSPRNDTYMSMTEKMKELYNDYLNEFYKSETVVYKDDEDLDYRRFIISAYDTSDKTSGNYILCNVYEDRIEFYHLITPIKGYEKEELNHANYILDSIYRYCSFSGASYEPRTYKQIQNNDLGSKK